MEFREKGSGISRGIIERLDSIPMPELFKFYHIDWEEGRNFKCPFPAHQASGKTPSGRYYKDTNSYGCFGCHKGGGPIHFIMNMEGLTYTDACNWLMNKYGIEKLPDFSYHKIIEKQEQKHKDEELIFKFGLLAGFLERCIKLDEIQLQENLVKFSFLYIQVHLLTQDQLISLIMIAFDLSLKDFIAQINSKVKSQIKLGIEIIKTLQQSPFEQVRNFNPKPIMSGLFTESNSGMSWQEMNNRYLFPILLPGNIIAGFSGRALGTEFVKYQTELWFQLSKKDLIYGLDVAVPAILKMGYVIIVEGILDVIRCRSIGFYNTVSPCCAYLSENQVVLLKSLTDKFILFQDNDFGGDQEAEMSKKNLKKYNLQFERVTVAAGEDPDSFGKENPIGMSYLLKSPWI